jgi:hypothetical protein
MGVSRLQVIVEIIVRTVCNTTAGPQANSEDGHDGEYINARLEHSDDSSLPVVLVSCRPMRMAKGFHFRKQ